MKLKKLSALTLAGITAAAMAIPASATSAIAIADVPAATYSVGIYEVTSSDFTVPAGQNRLLFDDNNVIMRIPGGTPVDDDYTTALQQNAELWNAVDSVTVSFIITCTDTDMAAGELVNWTNAYIQGGNVDGWDWKSFDYITEENPYEFGKEYTVTFDIASYQANWKGGLLKFGIAVGNNDIDDHNYHIEFTGLSVEGDQAVIDTYTAKAQELVAAATGTDTAPVETDGETTTSPETGVEGVAVFAGAALLAAGVVMVSRKRK